MAEPLSPLDVMRALDMALGTVEAFLDQDTPVDEDLPDLLRLHALLKSAAGNFGSFNQARMRMAGAIGDHLGERGRVVVDGRVWRRARVKSAKGLNRDWLKSQIGRAISGPIGIDADEQPIMPTEEQKLAAMWRYVDPAVGRTRQFRDAGIELDDAYDEIEWRSDLTDQ